MTAIAKSTAVSRPSGKPTYDCHRCPLTSLAFEDFIFELLTARLWIVSLYAIIK
jgi:hypothetical protein